MSREKKGERDLYKENQKRDSSKSVQFWDPVVQWTHFKSPELKMKENIPSIFSQILKFTNALPLNCGLPVLCLIFTVVYSSAGRSCRDHADER